MDNGLPFGKEQAKAYMTPDDKLTIFYDYDYNYDYDYDHDHDHYHDHYHDYDRKYGNDMGWRTRRDELKKLEIKAIR